MTVIVDVTFSKSICRVKYCRIYYGFVNSDESGKMYLKSRFACSLPQNLLLELTSLVVTSVIAFATGWLLYQIQFPAPYLLGSLFGVWSFGSVFAASRERLGIPRWFVKPVLLGLGVMMGAMFTPQIATSLIHWWPTVVTMIGATVVATIAGSWFLVRFRRYDKLLAVLCCLPGGQSEVIAISGELVRKDYVVALSHLMRVSLVFCIAPIWLTFAQGHAAVVSSNQALTNLPGLTSVSLLNIAWFLSVAIIGYLLARAIRLPMPHLLGSLLLSIILHSVGLVDEFLILAQIAIGGAIGARLAKVPFRTLSGYLIDSLMSASLVIGVYLLIAFGISWFSDIALLNLVLSFIPGGFYEVTLLALLFGFDVAFVTIHHVIRILLIFFSLAPLVNWLNHNGNARD